MNQVKVLKETINRQTLQKLNQRYIAFDVETTGLNAQKDRIIELGAVIFEEGKIIDTFSSLVNPHQAIPYPVTRVNHITNEMLVNAPEEKDIYPSFIDFMGNSLSGETIICAHNARFDTSFLKETFNRLGYYANVHYVDTLALSQHLIRDIEDHKQSTIGEYFHIHNENAHRASSDAEVCGKILWRLMDYSMMDYARRRKRTEKNRLSPEEQAICSYLYEMILSHDPHCSYLGFYKNSNAYIDIDYLMSFFKFKFARKGHYLIIPKKEVIKYDVISSPCTKTEGLDNVRIYFDSPDDLKIFKDFILKEYDECKALVAPVLQRHPYFASKYESNPAFDVIKQIKSKQ
jgi:DNA polymerase III epsilon subunit family exonuclease